MLVFVLSVCIPVKCVCLESESISELNVQEYDIVILRLNALPRRLRADFTGFVN